MPINNGRSFMPTDYALNALNPSSFNNFNYTGNWSMTDDGVFTGNDAQGAFYYTPFVNATSTGGSPNAAGTNGRWTEGGWVADPTQYFGIYQTPDGPNSENSARFAPQYAQGSQLVNLTGNMNLPGVGPNNTGWGYLSRTRPVVERHTPYVSSDPISEYWMPILGSLGVGAAAGLGAAAASAAEAAGAAGAAEGALAGGAFDMAGMGSASNLFGVGGSGAGTVAGLGDAAWGVNPSVSDAAIENAIQGWDAAGNVSTAGNLEMNLGNLWNQITSMPTTPSNALTGSDSTGAGATPNGAGGINNWLQETFGINANQAGSLASTLLGLFGSNAQANALNNVAGNNAQFQQQAFNMGAPYRTAALQMLNNPESFFSGPVAQSNLQGVLQGLSVNGNPFGNPTSLALAQQGQRGLYNSTLANLGQLGGLGGFNAAAANNNLATQLALQQAQQQGNMWNAAGAGLNSLLNPQPTLPQLLAMIGGNGLLGGGLAGSEDLA